MKIRLIIFFVFLFSDVSLICMDKQLPSDVLPQLIKISVLDGNFGLEKWKVLQSRSLIPCLEDKKNAFEIEIPIKAMRLFSNALDVRPGDAFKRDVSLLSTRDRDLLITAAGECDKDKKLQLNVPLLTAQLVEACLPLAVCEKIRSYITGDDEIKIAFINSMIKNSTIKNNFLPCKKSSYKPDEVSCDMTLKRSSKEPIIIDGIEWERWGGVIVDKERKYQLTPCKPCNFMHEWDKKEYFLWLLDSSNRELSKTTFLCEKLENLCFSSTGNFVSTYTGDKVSISSIVLCDNAVSISKTLTFYHKHTAKIQGICSGRALRKIVAWSFDGVQSFVSIWNGLGSIIAELEIQNAQVVQVELNRDENRLLIRTKPVTTGREMVMVYDTSNVLKIRLISKFSQESFEPAVYGMLGDMWVIPTGEHAIMFIRNTANGCALRTHTTQLQGYFISRPVLAACSSDNRLFVAVIPGSLGNTTIIWSALTGNTINIFHNCSENVKAIQIMPDNRSLLYKIQKEKPGNYRYYKQLLYSNNDEQILENIIKNASISELVVFRRLLLANNNKEIVELYPDEPAYKILESLLKKKHHDNVHKFIRKYLLWKVIDNKPIKDNKSIKKRFTFSS